MRRISAVLLAAILIATISVMWVPAKWATTIPEVAMCLLGAVWAGLLLARYQRPRWSFGMVPLAAFLVLILIQIRFGLTVYREATFLAFLYWAGNFATFFCALQTFASRDVRDLFLRGLAVFGTAISIFSTVQALTSKGFIYWKFPNDFELDRVFGPFVYRNQYAAFLELIIPIALCYALRGRRARFGYLAMAGIMYCAVITCASRMGFIVASAELAAVPFVVMRRGKLSSAQLGGASLVTVAMLLWLAMPEGSDLLVQGLGARDPFAARREFDISSLAMIRARPWTGFGLWNWPTAYPGYAIFEDGKFANQAHNDWAQWTVEGGIPLLAIMLTFAVWAAPRALRTGWGIGVLAIFVHCTVDYPIQRTGVAIVFFIMAAAIAGPESPRVLGNQSE